MPIVQHFSVSQWIGCLCLVGVIHPTLGSLVVPGYDAPFKLIMLLTSLFFASRPSLRHYYLLSARNVFCEFICLSLVLISVLVMIASWSPQLLLQQLFVVVSILSLYLISLFLRLDLNNFESVLAKAIIIAAFIAFCQCVFFAIDRSQYFVGSIRYESSSSLNLNHLAVLFPLSVFAGATLGSSISRIGVIILSLIGLSMLIARAAIIGFIAALFMYFLRVFPWIFNMLLFIFLGTITFGLLNLDYIYETNGLVLDAISSGRFRLWYHASDLAQYELLSTKLQEDDILVHLTAKSGHDTAYLHNSYLYTIINYGKFFFLFFLSAVIMVINSLRKRSSHLLLMFFLFIVFGSFFESLMDFQKLGLVFYALVFLVLKNDVSGDFKKRTQYETNIL